MADHPFLSVRRRNGKTEELVIGACAGVMLVRLVRLVLIGTGVAAARAMPWNEVLSTLQSVAWILS